MSCQRILLTTDFSGQARKASRAAASLARTYKARLFLVHVAQPLPPHLYMNLEGIETDLPTGSIYDGLEERLEAEAKHEGVFQGIEVETKLLFGAIMHEVLFDFIQERKVDLVVLSTHGHRGLGHVLLGSFTEKVVRYSQAPVLVYRERDGAPPELRPETVLVPFDFSENAQAVLPHVKFLARHYGSRFVFFHVLEPELLLPDRFSAAAWHEYTRRATDEARARLRSRFDSLREKELEGVQAELEIADGSPVVEIVERAKDCDLVLTSTHGWTGWKHLLLGSVAEKVVRKSPVSVLTIRPTEVRATRAEHPATMPPAKG